MRRQKFWTIAAVLSLFIPGISWGDVIDVTIKGIDDGVRTSKQQDYNEALMNAKLQAIERAGVAIESITRIVNFQVKFDMVESKAKAILMPGFQVVDIGYAEDGTYHVVLSGKIQVGERDQAKEDAFKGMTPINESYTLHKATDAYKGPNIGTGVARTLQAGQSVRGRARSEDGKWVFVEQNGQSIGFIYGPVLEEAREYEIQQQKNRKCAELLEIIRQIEITRAQWWKNDAEKFRAWLRKNTQPKTFRMYEQDEKKMNTQRSQLAEQFGEEVLKNDPERIALEQREQGLRRQRDILEETIHVSSCK